MVGDSCATGRIDRFGLHGAGPSRAAGTTYRFRDPDGGYAYVAGIPLQDDEAVATRILARRKSPQCWAGRDRVIGQEARSRSCSAVRFDLVDATRRTARSKPESRSFSMTRRSTAWMSRSRVSASMPIVSPRPTSAASHARRSPSMGIGTSDRQAHGESRHPGAKPIKQRQLRNVAKATACRIRSS